MPEGEMSIWIFFIYLIKFGLSKGIGVLLFGPTSRHSASSDQNK